MKTPRLQVYPQADTASILLWYGAGSEWRRWKRTVLLCDADSDTPEERRSVLVSRHVLVDKAAERAEAMTDEHIRGSDGVRNITQFLDSHYAPYQKISDREDFERGVYGYEWSSAGTCTAYLTEKRELFQRYEKALSGDCLPNLLKAKVVLRHSSTTEQAAQKVEKLLAGARDVTPVVQALCRLDTDVGVTSTFRQAKKTSSTFFDGRDSEENDGMLSGEDLDGKR